MISMPTSPSASSWKSSAMAIFGMLQLLLATSVGFVQARNAHFTMEFIPTFKNGLPHKCRPEEVKIIEKFLGDILAEETGMVEHSVQYLDNMYDAAEHHNSEASAASFHLKRHHFSKVRGFDFTFDCPTQNDHYACPDKDWCHVLCLDESVKPGHESLTQQASKLKEKLHRHSKTLEGPYNVKCLGHTAELDFHLLVSVSP
mmetsp:Transcript_15818/g.43752  ORF Transcript_15818/g.43752 Transcript_15818/m.43752 type:complete len:201 (+) Transcript_15818:253-855(+)